MLLVLWTTVVHLMSFGSQFCMIIMREIIHISCSLQWSTFLQWWSWRLIMDWDVRVQVGVLQELGNQRNAYAGRLNAGVFFNKLVQSMWGMLRWGIIIIFSSYPWIYRITSIHMIQLCICAFTAKGSCLIYSKLAALLPI